MSCSSASPALSMRARCSCTTGGTPSSVSASSAEPRIALSGVRISWLTVARNCVLASFAASACTIATSSSSCVPRSSVESVWIDTKRSTTPWSSRTGVMWICTQ